MKQLARKTVPHYPHVNNSGSVSGGTVAQTETKSLCWTVLAQQYWFFHWFCVADWFAPTFRAGFNGSACWSFVWTWLTEKKTTTLQWWNSAGVMVSVTGDRVILYCLWHTSLTALFFFYGSFLPPFKSGPVLFLEQWSVCHKLFFYSLAVVGWIFFFLMTEICLPWKWAANQTNIIC